MSRFENVCIIFAILEGEQSCTNCISIRAGDECQCDHVDGECQIENNNFIGGTLAKSEFQCWLQCTANDECIYYTWFSPENEDISNECFLFSSCRIVKECNGGCYVG